MFRKKNIPYILVILMILASFSSFKTQGATSTTENVISVENMADLLSYIPSIVVEYNDHNDTIGTWGYEIIDEEEVDGIPSWKVESSFGEEGDKESYVTWVSKVDGAILKVEVEGNVITGVMASMLGNVTFSFWYAMVYSYWTAWNYEELKDMPEYGTLSYLGSSQEMYGPTSLTVFKYKFEGIPTAPDIYGYTVEFWLAPTQFGGITTYLYLQSNTDVDEWFSLEIKHIELIEPQEVPPTPKPEPEPEPEPEKSGGIPGFPYESILVGLLIAVGLLMIIRKK